MDSATATIITVMREQPLLAFAAVLILFLLLLPLKRWLARKLMPISRHDD